MSNSADFDENASKRTFTAPYSSRHPVPTVQGYQARKEERQADHEASTTAPASTNASPRSTKSKRRSLLSSAKDLLRRDSTRSVSKGGAVNGQEPYKAENRNVSTPVYTKDWAQQEDGKLPKADAVQEQGQSAEDVKQEAQQQSQTDGHIEPNESPQEAYKEQGQDQHEAATQDAAPQQDGTSEYEKQGDDKSSASKAEESQSNGQGHGSLLEDTSQAIDNTLDPRQKRKNMKHMSRDSTEREVTDPVTHMPVTVHDSTDQELEAVPENEPPAGTEPRSATGLSGKTKSASEIEREINEEQAEHRGMEKLFPPPPFGAARDEIASVYGLALTVGLSSVLLVPLLLLVGAQVFVRSQDDDRSWLGILLVCSILLVLGLLSGGAIIYALRGWLKNRIRSVWDDHLWELARKQESDTSDSPTPESVQWLNSLLGSVWGLINPDLFASLVDTLEDVMQASLPKLVRMISVEDLGQGSEAIRILGVRWLPTGAAAQNVSQDGKVKFGKNQDSDRKVAGEGQIDDKDKNNDTKSSDQQTKGTSGDPKDESEDDNVAEGMEAEEGDFVNMEVAFSYRASTSSKSLHDKSKNAHLFLGFYLPGSIKFPVWVELRGLIGTMRMRLQLCPDPPFFALCTLTLLGQPKADLSCIPLMKKGLNIMDLPLISSFVQSSIDAALAEYVAPKSLTLDLKDMLVGDDFKKDTVARGVIMVRIKRGREFKCGDPGMMGLKQGSSDAYVAVGWAKFGKPVWSTRVIVDCMQPVWEETAFLLVGPEELNAQERLRVQLWDSDKMSADDDLGRIEINLDEIMTGPNSKGKMWDRTDGFQALKSSETMPGTLDWSVGYFAKQRIQPEQLEKQQVEPDINSVTRLKKKVSKDADRKLREAADRDESLERDQQKAQDLKVREDAMIIATPPLHDYPTGIFSIQIHNITGLEMQKLNKSEAKPDEGDDIDGGGGDLPSSYCTVILNHQKIFKTRTKPKNAKPFFNAGTERLIRDWRTTEIMIACRDSRVHENDALLGIVYLPLGKILAERSQVVDSYPLVGGIGYGRARISMVFRSIDLVLPKQLLGWDFGTIQITGAITSKDLKPELQGLRLKLHTTVNRGKMYSSNSDDGSRRWTGKRDRPVHLAVRKRYCSNIVIEFRKNSMGLDKTPAFGVLWLKDIPDETEVTVKVLIWRTNKDNLKRGESNVEHDLGERMGTLEVPLKFYRGLGVYHQRMASKSPNLQDVLEVLSVANDSKEVHIAMGGDHIDDSSSQSDSSDDDQDNSSGRKNKSNGFLKKIGLDKESDDDSVDDGKGGPMKQIKDYKAHSSQLHREHRGVMQWKGARTADYMKTKVEHGKDHLLDHFKHHERDPGIETEV